MLRSWGLVALMLVGCPSKPPDTPKPQPKRPGGGSAPTVETEAEREAKRLEAAHAIIPKGTTCLPVALRKKQSPRLELAALGSDAILCAFDTQRNRLLGPVGCWKIELGSGGLTYREPAPLPGIGFAVRIEEPCVRGFCLPKETALPADKVAFMAYSLDGSKVAIVAGEQLSVFDTKTRRREGGFSIKGTGDVSGLYLLGESLFVEAGGEGKRRVYQFQADGTKLGAITDDKDQPILNGSFSILDKTRVALGEAGWPFLIVLDTETGKKSRIARQLPKSPCTAEETEHYWADTGDVSEKCNNHMVKTFDHLVGATAVAGARNLLVVLRNGRLGELGVFDATTLVEKKAINLEWCEADDKPEKAEKPRKPETKPDRSDSDEE